MAVFQFKQFSVAQDQCAQKIGTDGVLLGAWAGQGIDPGAVLDVGTGTGVIALMLAQRFKNAYVEAIEIDEKAYEQAVQNTEGSPFFDRCFVYHASFQEYFTEIEESYDLIVSNPPFFEHTSHPDMANERKAARFEDSMPIDHLLYGAARLLAEEGTFALIFPKDRETELLEVAAHFGLHPQQITDVQGHASAPVKRVLVALGFRRKANIERSTLIIEHARHQYTDQYMALTKDFYLKM